MCWYKFTKVTRLIHTVSHVSMKSYLLTRSNYKHFLNNLGLFAHENGQRYFSHQRYLFNDKLVPFVVWWVVIFVNVVVDISVTLWILFEKQICTSS